MGSEPIHVGGDKQLFIDHRFIERSEQVTLRVNPPRKDTVDRFPRDKPWEAFTTGWYSIDWDPEARRYKKWYAACDGDQWAGGSWRLCYAESPDGLAWEKPDLGLVEYGGSRDNNILIDGEKLTYTFRDPHACGPHGRPQERFKMIRGFPEKTKVGTSPDGIRWDLPDRPVSDLPPGWDTAKQAWWDERIGRYVVYLRVQIEEENELPYPFAGPIDSDPPVVQPTLARPIRAIGRLETDDLTAPWPDDEIRTVLCADQDDPPGCDIYHAGVYPYPYAADAYFMFPLTYHHFTEAESPVVRNDGVNDCQFCASRDGIHWMRYDRRPYIGRGIQGEFDGGGIHGSPYLIRRGAELYQHYGGEPWTHGQYRRLSDQERRDRANWARGRSCVAVQRLDGFVSADAAYEGGALLTPPLTFDGDRLELNIDMAAMGEARVELRDREGRPIDGFGAADCDRLTCNDVAARVRWRGSEDLGALRGRPVRLHVRMRSAKLYAFQFASA